MENFHGIVAAVAAVIFVTILILRNRKTAEAPQNWPIMGMLPSLLWNLSDFHEWATAIVKRNGGTLRFHAGLCRTSFQIMTSNPANIDHVLKICCKSPFPCFGDIDEEELLGPLGRNDNIMLIQKMAAERILPALEEAHKRDLVLDLQNLLLGFGLDCACTLAGLQGCLTPPFVKSFEETMEAWAYSLVSPTIYHDKYMRALKRTQKLASNINFSSVLKIMADKRGVAENFCCDNAVGNWVLVCRDVCAASLCWFFWFLSRNPDVEDKIMEEMYELLDDVDGDGRQNYDDYGDRFFSVDELNRMQYMEAALCEALRLYPPFPLGHMRATEDQAFSGWDCRGEGDGGSVALIWGESNGECVGRRCRGVPAGEMEEKVLGVQLSRLRIRGPVNGGLHSHDQGRGGQHSGALPCDRGVGAICGGEAGAHIADEVWA